MRNDIVNRRHPASRTEKNRAASSVIALTLLTVSTPAWAYLDPGTGSMIISAIVGLFATVGLAVKTYWYKLKGFFRRNAQAGKSASEPATDAAGDSDADASQLETRRSTES
ncbi:MAG: hypothetical protein KJO76_01760 [Gammaproteobacteria bacterium]|nr:hypothetical protein [Gammaproteobacteria bacterium]NND36077.1 hypothetical protein [Gammaproteobacteria bacterium]